jgi:hypothetical protein
MRKATWVAVCSLLRVAAWSGGLVAAVPLTAGIAAAQPATPTPPPPPPTPSFPSRTCDVKNAGAKGDGSTDDTDAINSAISSCSSAGGGTVNFPSGTYMAAGIHIKSNTRLLLNSGATIKARSSGYDSAESNSFSQYQDFGHSHFHTGLMWGENINNFAIEGPGKIDGAGLTTGDPSSGQGDKQVSIKTCNTVSFKNLSQVSGGHFYYLLSDCTNVTFDNVTLDGGRDGIDFMGCKHVDVNRLTVKNVGDDACALKNDYAQGHRLLTQDTYIHDSSFHTKCNAIQVGSETAGDFRNCHWQRITVLQAGKAGIGLQTNDGGILDGFYINDVTMTRAANPIFISSSGRLRTPENVTIGHVQNVSISNVTSTNSVSSNSAEPANTATISGRPGILHENIILTNVRITGPGGGSFDDGNINPPLQPSTNYNPRIIGKRPAYGLYARHVQNLQLHNTDFDFSGTDLRPAVVADNIHGFEVDDISAERASGGWASLKVMNLFDFFLHNSAGWPTVQLASVSSATYTAGSVTPTPVGPTPTPTPTATPTTVTPTPTPGGGGTGATWEAQSLSPTASGASTSMQNDSSATGGTWLALMADGAGDWVQFAIPNLEAGTYSVTLRYKAHTARGILQASVDGMNLGSTLDQYTASPGFMTRTFGSVDLGAGTHTLRLTCTGKNSASSAFTLSADTITFTLTGTPPPTPTPTPTGVPTATPTPTPTVPTGGDVEVTPSASGVSASTNDGNVPGNTVDNNLTTRWSAIGDGQWLKFDLGATLNVTRVKVAVYNGNTRQNRFDLQTSTDDTNWTTVLGGLSSSGTTTQEEPYDVPVTGARWVRYLGHGSSDPAKLTTNSVTEVSIFAQP